MTTLSYDQGYHDALLAAFGAFGGTLLAIGALMALYAISSWIHGRNRD